MARQSKRVQPYHGEDGDYRKLLDFALPAAQLLDPEFNPPKVLIQREDSEGMQDVMRYYKRCGDEQQGFETTHIIELEPKASGHAVDRVQLSTFGLPEGYSLEMECARVWYDPRFIEIRVEGPKKAVEAILSDFETIFGGTKLDPAKLKQRLLSAEISLKAGAWDAALMKAEDVLSLGAEQPDAHFVQGAAHMAKGELEEAAKAFERVIELQPEHLHAHLNLGLLKSKQGLHAAARSHFEAVLGLEAQHPEALLQLGLIAEELSDHLGALDAYQRLMEAPAVEDGKDYVSLAVEGVGRVTGRIAGKA